MRRYAVTRAWLATCVIAFAACGSDFQRGDPTGSTCPPAGSTPTWDNFVQRFMVDYGRRCHDGALFGHSRIGAAEGYDFDTVAGVRAVAVAVDETTAAGPDQRAHAAERPRAHPRGAPDAGRVARVLTP